MKTSISNFIVSLAGLRIGIKEISMPSSFSTESKSVTTRAAMTELPRPLPAVIRHATRLFAVIGLLFATQVQAQLTPGTLDPLTPGNSGGGDSLTVSGQNLAGDYGRLLERAARLAKDHPDARHLVSALTQARVALAQEATFQRRLAAHDDKITQLPPVILARQRQAKEDAQRIVRQVRDIIKRAQTAHARGDDIGAAAILQELTNLSEAPPRKHWRVSLAPTRDAFHTCYQLDQHLGVPPIQLAAAGSLSGIVLPDSTDLAPPDAADLAETDETRRTPEILALVQQLGGSPVRIHNWVRNNIRPYPGYGSAQSAAATLAARRGTDAEIANLLVALLRAANIPARYSYGTIELPEARLGQWLNLSPADARDILSRAGVPLTTVTTAQGASAVQLEHIWVRAWVDFAPSRGAVNRQPDTWVVMDPSFKTTQATGQGVLTGLAFNAQGIRDAALQNATCTATSASGLATDAVADGLTTFTANAGNAIAALGADATVGDVIGRDAIVAENYSTLMGSLPYRVVAETGAFAALPPQLKWAWRLKIYSDTAAQTAGTAVVSVEQDFASLADRRLSLSFAPETQDDADVLALYLPKPHADGTPVQPSEYPAELPAYLIKVKAELRQDGSLLATGGSFVLGSRTILVTETFDPAKQAWQADADNLVAGELHAFGFDARGLPAYALQGTADRAAATKAKLDAGNSAGLTLDDTTGELLTLTALDYFALLDAGDELTYKAGGPLSVRLPSIGRAVARLEPVVAMGLVSKVRFPGLALQVDRLAGATPSATRIAATRQSLQRASANAHQVLERAFATGQGSVQGVSAISALVQAQKDGQSLILADATHPLAAGNLGPDIAAAAQDAVASGSRALVNAAPISLGNWSGDALASEDPASGAGLYAIALGNNAGGLATGLLDNGWGWLALASPAQIGAAGSTALDGAIVLADKALALLDDPAGTRWSAYPAKADLLQNLYIAKLGAAQSATQNDTAACTWLVGVAASDLGSGLSGTDPYNNHAPVILSTPATVAKGELPYRYQIQATDPDNDPLAYTLADAPAGMNIDSTGLIVWPSAVPGSYAVRARVDDGKAFADQSWLLTVGAADAPLQLSLAISPAVVAAGGAIDIIVQTAGGSQAEAPTLTIDGQAVVIDADGHAHITAAASGTHRIVATVSDLKGTLTREGQYSVTDPTDTTVPTAAISTPTEDTEITAPTRVTGTATDAHFAYYRLLIRPTGGASNAWSEIVRSYTPVDNGDLGAFDPSTLDNGLYDLALQVVDVNGGAAVAMTRVEVTRELKIGQFSVSFEDLNVEAAGLPIRLTRTYSTLRKNEALDFGYGWSISYQDIKIRKNMAVGQDWIVSTQNSLYLCLRPNGKRKVSITLPGGKVERFEASNAVECSLAAIPAIDIKFTPLAGTTSQLEVVNIPNLLQQGNQIYDMDNLEPWDPKDFKLTAEDGTVYYLKEGVGIVKIKDVFGNTLDFGANGILSSSGQSIQFERDGQGRIVSVTDPTGKQVHYRYSSAGDLASVTDRNGQVSQMTYATGHLLAKWTDPTGAVLIQNRYDDQGRLVESIDAAGNKIETQHDDANNQEIVKNRRGYSTTYQYDADGNITRETNALGQSIVHTYDALGNETGTTDALGHSLTKTYNGLGKPLTETDALGNTTTYAYDPQDKSQLTSTTDALGNVTTYSYFGKAPTRIDEPRIDEPLGRSTALGYDGKGNLARLDLAGQQTTYTYDANGNRTSETDPAGNVTTYSFDANGRETGRSYTRTNAQGQTETITLSRVLDAEGRVIEETDALGNHSKTSYNGAGKPTQVTDVQGRITTYAYDAQARLTKTIYPDGTWEATDYDANGNEVASTDRAGRTTRKTYDALDRLVKITYPDSTTETTEYDAAGRVIATVDAQGHKTANVYDAAGRLTQTTDPAGAVTTYQYDANGNRTKATDGQGRTTTYQYDALNRLIQTTLPNGGTQTLAWRPDGRKASDTDEAGNLTRYGYDAAGRLNQVTQALASGDLNTAYTYDELGNKTSQTDAAGRTTKWAYDKAGRPISRTLPNGESETWQYDAAGNLTRHSAFDGQTTRYTYDSNDRRTLTLFPDGSKVAVTYSASGEVESKTDANGKTTYAYDLQGRPIRQANPDGSVLTWAYDAAGNLIERSSPQGTTRYAYDDANRLIKTTDPQGKVTRQTWNATGQPTQVSLPNGTETRFEYDPDGRLVQQTSRNSATGRILAATRYTVTGGLRTKVETYDGTSSATEAGSGLQLADPATTQTYTYDALKRLTRETRTVRGSTDQWTTTWAYDKVGNRSQQTVTLTTGTGTASEATTTLDTTTYTYDNNDRLTETTKLSGGGTGLPTTYAWDANGNLSKKQTPSETTLYGWDTENRLIEVKRGSSEATATTVATYRYDADGNRIQKTEPGSAGNPDKVTSYLVDSTFPYAQTRL